MLLEATMEKSVLHQRYNCGVFQIILMKLNNAFYDWDSRELRLGLRIKLLPLQRKFFNETLHMEFCNIGADLPVVILAWSILDAVRGTSRHSNTTRLISKCLKEQYYWADINRPKAMCSGWSTHWMRIEVDLAKVFAHEENGRREKFCTFLARR